MRTHLVAVFTLTSSMALAQAAEPQQPGSSDTTTPTAESTATPAEPTADERLTNAEGKIASLEEQNVETKNDLSALKKLKISGYVQGRYQYQEPLDDTGTGGFSKFTVRRGRLKTTYTTDWAQLMLQIDAASESGVTLRDAEATLFFPGTHQLMGLTVGQMKWPFGYEGPQSSSDREMPERSRVIRAFLPDERDRGAKLFGKFLKNKINIGVGVFDGNGIFNQNSVGLDNDKEKDVIGRAGFDLKWLSGGVSGWYGHSLGRKATDTYRVAYDRNRIGLDAQLYLDVLPFGATAIKGEYINGTTYSKSAGQQKVEQLGVPASGWYGLVVQNLGLKDAVAVRYDYFDPESGRENLATPEGKPGPNNSIGTLDVALLHYFSENLKATLSYELPMTAAPGTAEDPHDNLLTFQLQARY
ncbi:porin [Pyxidicoccus parkwayensis]|uniref:Porin n=1 Tax=Pyxidicoccus parkwayensis TaxID=2813578 RepID=A0ABX7P372_9BACT|nr:porin [Pyxidicoccus parkwaysis]QSQ24903.1 porin [Pyxidicoccus parkwaysis]